MGAWVPPEVTQNLGPSGSRTYYKHWELWSDPVRIKVKWQLHTSQDFKVLHPGGEYPHPSTSVRIEAPLGRGLSVGGVLWSYSTRPESSV